MSRKRAFFVMGPPSSGTRLMVRLLIAAGCEGDGDHAQRWDDEQPTAELIVMRRHEPNGRVPDWALNAGHDNVILALQNIGYEVFGVIISRDWHCTISSQVAAPHVQSYEEGVDLTRLCWRSIFENMPEGLAYEIVSYESLVQRSDEAVGRLLAHLGLTAVRPVEPIKDANAKYYG